MGRTAGARVGSICPNWAGSNPFWDPAPGRRPAPAAGSRPGCSIIRPHRIVMPSTVVQAPAAGPQLRLAALPPLALYVHIPWCVRKCPYCDFNSHEVREALPEGAYVDALIADLERALPSVWGRRVHSIFFGGGTPSLFSADGDRPSARRRSARGCRSRPTPRSRSRRIRARSRREKFARLPRRRREPALDRHPELRSATSEGARPHPRRSRGAARDRDRARDLRQLQPRPDVRAARTDAGRG